jgi:Cu-Zn family superoxide dismutase
MRSITRSATLVVAMAAVFVAASVGTASAADGRAVRGAFHAFAAGASDPSYQDISGHAQLVRTADGKTIVSVHAEGLLPETTYPSHVHAKACGALNTDGTPAFAGGHYKIDPTVTATVASNEIWPGPFTTDEDGVGNGRTMVEHSARADAVSVVIHAPSGAKIACADLA